MKNLIERPLAILIDGEFIEHDIIEIDESDVEDIKLRVLRWLYERDQFETGSFPGMTLRVGEIIIVIDPRWAS